MGFGAGAAGFGGGFASGLTGVLLKHREDQAQAKRDAETRKDRLFGAMLPTYLDNVENVADLEPLFADRFPDLFTKAKKGQPSAFETMAPFLQPVTGKTKSANSAAYQADATAAAASGEQVPLENTPKVSAGQPPAAQRTLMGVPVMSRAQKQARATQDAEAELTGSTEAKVAVARKMVANGSAKSLPDALAMVGLKGLPPVELNANTSLVEQGTGTEIAAGPTSATGAGGYNVQHFTGTLEGEPRSRAREFIFDPRTKTITEQDGTPVKGRVMHVPDLPVQPIVVQTSNGPQTLNRGASTTREIRDANGNVVQGPLPAAMREKLDARAKVGQSVNAIKSIGDSIITQVGPKQRADALKRGAAAVFGNDAAFKTYQDARMALAGNLAVAQQGGRVSDADVKALWLPLIPDPYTDTKASSDMKWRLIRITSGIDENDLGAAPAGGGGGAQTPPAAPGVQPRAVAPGPGAGPNAAGATAQRMKARQFLIAHGKQADEATINVFLGKPANIQVLGAWQPGAP